MINLGASLNSLNTTAKASTTSSGSVRDWTSATSQKVAEKAVEKNPASSNSSAPAKKTEKNFAQELKDRSAYAERADETASSPDNTRDPASPVRERSGGEEITPTEAALAQRKSKTATRQAALEVFLDRMQNELGISSGDVLQAFAELSAEDLAASPADSAAAVVAKLGLNEEESLKALDMYNEMLMVSAAGGLSQQLNVQGQKAELNVMSRDQARLRDLRHSITDMSDKFFMTGGYSPKTGVDQQDKISQAASMPASAFLAGAGRPEMLEASAANLPTPGLTPMGSGLNSIDGFDISDFDEVTPEAAENFDIPEYDGALMGAPETDVAPNAQAKPQVETYSLDDLNAMAQSAGADGSEAILTPKSSGTQLGGPSAWSGLEATDNPGIAVAGLGGGSSSNDQLGAFGEDDELSGDEFAETGFEGIGEKTGPNGLQQKPVFNIGAPKATTADVQANVKEVISQAQYLAGKGGGEMKIALNPLGLGEINLKVKMVKGQVNIEMVTASDEAKKVLEKGLGDLKESLAAHKLNLESIKIDQSKDISRHMDQQRHDAEQGFQQKFLNDFRERNGSNKREMFELGAASQPTSQTRDRALNASYNPSASKRADGSRRLDLVA